MTLTELAVNVQMQQKT